MANHVCPWWLGPILASPVRRLFQNPEKLLTPYVSPGMTVLEPGSGMGFFTLDLARLTGPAGRVIAVDLQPMMLKGLMRRAKRAGLGERIETRIAETAHLGIGDLVGSVDLVLAFASVHEMPSAQGFFSQVAPCLKPEGRVLLAEPRGHVPPELFAVQIEAAQAAGLVLTERPAIRRSLTAVLRRA